VRHLVRVGKNRPTYRLLVGQSEGRRVLGRPRCRLVDSIEMDVVETGWTGLVWLRTGTGEELL
jgi:hypothetical protein